MSQVQIEFAYDGANTIIQCLNNDKLKDIYQNFKLKVQAERKNLIYMYNGKTIDNDELTFNDIANFEDKTRNKMNILVIEGEGTIISESERIIKSNNIICPECKEDIKYTIEDYKINLFECKNKHEINNIFLDEFDSTQNINISKIKCQICGQYNKGNVHNNIFYRCNSCKKDICPICYSNHDKSHKIINYDDKNYMCNEHNKVYTGYCEDCKQDICIYCEQYHNNHKIITYGKLIPDRNKINNKLKELEEKKNKLNNDINEIIVKLNKLKENYEKYYNINKNIINNYNEDKINYEILYNINNINNNDIINDINNIINDNNIQNKFNKLINIYDKMNKIDYITIIYNINKSDDELQLFHKEFIKNNINNAKIIINKKEYDLF